MNTRILVAFLAGTILSTAAIDAALSVTANASNNATMCCLPNGGEISSVQADLLAIATMPDDPAWFNAQVRYTFLTTARCDFSGERLVDTNNSFRITENGNSVALRFTRVNQPCPFGIRSQAFAVTFGGPEIIFSIATSFCSQPCHACQGPPIYE